MKYIIYLRVSTDQQVSSGLGLEAQRQICLKFVPNGSEVLEFADEGLSGALEMEKRPALLQALGVLSKDDILLVAKRDRIGRDPIVNAMIERAVERKKARLVSASGDVKDGNDPSAVLMRRMVDAFAEYERLIIGARTKCALNVLKTYGKRIGHIPYGYRLCIDNIHLEHDNIEQDNLKIMKEMREKGISLREISNEMNLNKRWNRKGPWNHVSVKRVIKC